MEVGFFHDNHLRWEKLDIDLEIESLIKSVTQELTNDILKANLNQTIVIV